MLVFIIVWGIVVYGALLVFLGHIHQYIVLPIYRYIAKDGKGSKTTFFCFSFVANLFCETVGNLIPWTGAFVFFWCISYFAVYERTMYQATLYALFPMVLWAVYVAVMESYKEMRFYFKKDILSRYGKLH